MSLEYIYYRLTKKNAPAYSLSGKTKNNEYKRGGTYVCSSWHMLKEFFRMLKDNDIETITIKKY